MALHSCSSAPLLVSRLYNANGGSFRCQSAKLDNHPFKKGLIIRNNRKWLTVEPNEKHWLDID
jgi:hypothetical protein